MKPFGFRASSRFIKITPHGWREVAQNLFRKVRWRIEFVVKRRAAALPLVYPLPLSVLSHSPPHTHHSRGDGRNMFYA